MTEWERAIDLCQDIARHPLHPSLDCTEIVERFLRICPTGQMQFIHGGPQPKAFVIWEHGHWVPFVYHAIFVLQDYVFDPYWSAEPLPVDSYREHLQAQNPTIPLQWANALPEGYIQ